MYYKSFLNLIADMHVFPDPNSSDKVLLAYIYLSSEEVMKISASNISSKANKISNKINPFKPTDKKKIKDLKIHDMLKLARVDVIENSVKLQPLSEVKLSTSKLELVYAYFSNGKTFLLLFDLKSNLEIYLVDTDYSFKVKNILLLNFFIVYNFKLQYVYKFSNENLFLLNCYFVNNLLVRQSISNELYFYLINVNAFGIQIIDFTNFKVYLQSNNFELISISKNYILFKGFI